MYISKEKWNKNILLSLQKLYFLRVMKTFSTVPNDETLPYLRGVYSSIGFFRNLSALH